MLVGDAVMPALSEIIVAIIALSLVIGLMVGWCVGAWRNRIVYRDEDNEPYGEANTYRRDGL